MDSQKVLYMLNPLSPITKLPACNKSKNLLDWTISLSLMLPVYNADLKLKCIIGEIETSALKVQFLLLPLGADY